jgi:hypothetical protein
VKSGRRAFGWPPGRWEGGGQSLGLDVAIIQALSAKDNVAFKKHAVVRMRQRSIFADEVKAALRCCKIIEEYLNARPLPSGLILGYANKRPLHMVVAVDRDEEMLWLITVYEPTLEMWENGFDKRRGLE